MRVPCAGRPTISRIASRAIPPTSTRRIPIDPLRPSNAPPLFAVAAGRSGHLSLDERLDPLRDAARDSGRELDVAVCDAPEELRAAAARASGLAAERGGVVVASGGDGSVGVVARAALETGATLAILPGGTFNLLARDNRIPEEPVAAARNVMEGEVRDVRVGLAAGTPFFVNASLGLYPRVLAERERAKRRFGRHRWVAILSAFDTVRAGLRASRLVFERDGAAAEIRRTPILFVGNNALQLERVGAVPAEDDASLVAFATPPVSRSAMFRMMIEGALGRLDLERDLERWSFRTLTVSPAPRRGLRRAAPRRPRRLALDGETFRFEPPWTFAVRDAPLRLVVPRDAADRAAS